MVKLADATRFAARGSAADRELVQGAVPPTLPGVTAAGRARRRRTRARTSSSAIAAAAELAGVRPRSPASTRARISTPPITAAAELAGVDQGEDSEPGVAAADLAAAADL